MSTGRPMFFRNSYNEQRIVHREKISKYTTPGTTGAFSVLASLPINPGLPGSFPWLSNQAAGWESYRFNRLRYIWIPTAASSKEGNIIMAPDYDAADAAPVGETFMSSYSDVKEGNLWLPFAAELTPSLLNGEMKRHFVRLGALGSNLDIKTYDSGNFFVASTDDTAAAVGKLWVEYDVSLFNPQVPPGGFQANGVMSQGGASIAAATPFGTVPVASGAIQLSATSTNVITIANVQAGQEILLACEVTGTVITAATLSTLVGLTAKTPVIANIINAGQTAAIVFATYTVTAQNPTVTLALTATTIVASLCSVSVVAPIANF